jgi:hypothetical protein
VLAVDFDAHSQCWNLRGTEWRKATYWEESIYQHGQVIQNYDQPTHYWMRNESEGASIIDFTLANLSFG